MTSKNKFYLFGLGIIIIFFVVLGIAKNLYWPSPKVINNDQSEITIPPAKTATSTEEVYTNKKGQKWTLDAKAEFTISSAPAEKIKFLEGKIDPLKVHPGDVQNMKIVVQGVNGISGVRAEIETDNGTTTVALAKTGVMALENLNSNIFAYDIDQRGDLQILSAEEAKNNRQNAMKADATSTRINSALASVGDREIWEGSWTVKDTSVREYKTIFVASDSQGNEKRLVMAWSDPCPALVGYWSDNGTATANQPCTIGAGTTYGADNANLVLQQGANITVSSNATWAFNPGTSISLSGGVGTRGSFTLLSGGTKNSGAQIKKAYLWAQDTDGDHYQANTSREINQSSTNPPYPGMKRQSTITSDNIDCNDASATVWQNLTGYIDSDSDGYGAGSASQVCSGASLLAGYVSNNTDCYNSNANVKPSQVNWWSSAGSGWTPVGDYNCSGVAQYAWAQNLSYTNYTPAQTTESQSSAWTIACSQYTGTQYTASACGTTIGYTGSIFVIASGAFNNSCDTARANSELRYWTAGPLISVCK